jgi:hypothetical protein
MLQFGPRRIGLDEKIRISPDNAWRFVNLNSFNRILLSLQKDGKSLMEVFRGRNEFWFSLMWCNFELRMEK